MTQRGKDKLIIRYLLNESSEGERARLEELYFNDDQYFEEILAAEDELIDAYVRGAMPARERERFESHYLTTPQRCQRVKFARSLMKTVGAVPAAPPPTVLKQEGAPSWRQSLLLALRPRNFGVQVALMTAVLAVVFGGLWWWVENVRERDTLDRLAAQQRQSQEGADALPPAHDGGSSNDSRSGQTGREPAGQQAGMPSRTSNRVPRPGTAVGLRPPPPSVASFVLTPVLVRGPGAANRLTIPPGKDLVELRINIGEANYQSYSAKLETVDGQEIWSRGGLKARSIKSGIEVKMRLPARLLSNRDYILSLRGAGAGGQPEDVDEYSFRVVKR